MNKYSVFKLVLAVLTLVGVLASAPANADSLYVRPHVNETDVLLASVNVGGSTKGTSVSYFNVTNLTTGDSFKAFCFELLQPAQKDPLGVEYTPVNLTNDYTRLLYEQSFSEAIFSDKYSAAAFQIAIWETQDDNNLTTGNYKDWAMNNVNLTAIEASFILTKAEAYLSLVRSGVKGTNQFDLTVWESPTSQNLIQASPLLIPEPSALLLVSLGLMLMFRFSKRREQV